jgi:ATP-dependent protease ClpP protease subunit
MGKDTKEEQENFHITLEQASELGLLDKPDLTHTLFFDDEINSETVQRLINELNNYSTIDLFFTTEGGNLSVMEALIHYLNSRKDDITIILTEEICSAGTFLLTDFEGNIKISKSLDFILFHIADRMTYTSRKNALNMKELGKQLKVLNEELIDKYTTLGLTTSEIRKFKAGYDVILYRKDFHRLNIKNTIKDE